MAVPLPPPPPVVINISSPPPSTPSKPPSSSLHRLPTVSASQALQDLQKRGSEASSIGVGALDELFGGSPSAADHGGFERRKVTELWGPKGAGKTAIALQAAVTATKHGHHVVWLDATTPLNGGRLATTLSAALHPSSPEQHSQALERFHHRSLPTLSHLLALLQTSQPAFPPANTTLIIIDNLHTLLDLDYPRLFPSTASTPSSHARWASSRRYAVLGALGAALTKLAVLASAAVVVTTGCATRGRGPHLGPALVPGVGGGDGWEAAVAARAVVFRDCGARFVGLVKAGGRGGAARPRDEVGEVGRLCEFEIGQDGVVRGVASVRAQVAGEEVGVLSADGSVRPATVPRVELLSSPVKARKRVHEEIADSDEEDVDEYGWDDDAEDAITAGALTAGPSVAAVDAVETQVNESAE